MTSNNESTECWTIEDITVRQCKYNVLVAPQKSVYDTFAINGYTHELNLGT